jgi:hypothetical protein
MSVCDDAICAELALAAKARKKLLSNRKENRERWHVRKWDNDQPYTMSDSQAAKELGLFRLDK